MLLFEFRQSVGTQISVCYVVLCCVELGVMYHFACCFVVVNNASVVIVFQIGFGTVRVRMNIKTEYVLEATASTRRPV